MDYGFIFPSSVYQKLSELVKDQPKSVKTVIGVVLGWPLVLIDIALAVAAPIIAFIAFIYLIKYVPAHIPYFVPFFLFQLLLAGLCRWAVLRGRKAFLFPWLGYMMVINLTITFWKSGFVLPLYTGLFFMAATVASTISNAIVLQLELANKMTEKAWWTRQLVELIFLISSALLFLG